MTLQTRGLSESARVRNCPGMLALRVAFGNAKHRPGRKRRGPVQEMGDSAGSYSGELSNTPYGGVHFLNRERQSEVPGSYVLGTPGKAGRNRWRGGRLPVERTARGLGRAKRIFIMSRGSRIAAARAQICRRCTYA
jgi:hypothetical protein